jgi:hypothetical protein
MKQSLRQAVWTALDGLSERAFAPLDQSGKALTVAGILICTVSTHRVLATVI